MAEHRRPAGQTFGEQLTEYLEATTRANGLRAGEWPQQTTEPPRMTVHKVEGYLPIPEEILMDEGIIPDTRPPRPRPAGGPDSAGGWPAPGNASASGPTG